MVREPRVPLHSCLGTSCDSGGCWLTASSPLIKRPQMRGLTERLNPDRLKSSLCEECASTNRLYMEVKFRRLPAKRRIWVHREALISSSQLPLSKFVLVPGIQKSTGTQLPNSKHDPASTPVTEPHPNKTEVDCAVRNKNMTHTHLFLFFLDKKKCYMHTIFYKSDFQE